VKPKRLTDFNHEIATLDLGDIDTFAWKGPDGFAEDGVVVYPPNFARDKKYPLVLWIHGGPTAIFPIDFDIVTQLMASHGYVVFAPNYRGSDNLGSKYQLAIVKDLVDGPAATSWPESVHSKSKVSSTNRASAFPDGRMVDI